MKTTRETPSFTCKVLTGLQATSTSKVLSSALIIRDISPPARRARAAGSQPAERVLHRLSMRPKSAEPVHRDQG